MMVYKFGGSSVGKPERMKQVLNIVNTGQGKVVVLSALSGTTDQLTTLNDLLKKSSTTQFSERLQIMKDRYSEFINDLYTKPDNKQKAEDVINERFDVIESFSQDVYTRHEEKLMLAQGELMSTALFQILCEENNVKSKLLPALDFMRINNEKEPDYYFIKINLERLLQNSDDETLYITQGYICRNAFGEVDNLQRGGSDYTASLIGAAINSPEIQIWTDIDGMHNNDPRVVDNTNPIKELSFNEAAELAYFGAKILHPSSVRPAQDKDIPVRLKSTLQPELEGTVISKKSNKDSIKAVAAKDGITAVKIKSGRMLMAYGFLRSVFEVFEWYKTPIDLITTSEVAVSVTIDHDERLEDIQRDLAQYGIVEIDRNQTIVCVVGDFLAERSGFGAKIFNALKDIPLRMVSYGGSRNNISFLIDTNDKKPALQALNTLFKQS